jgi:hypothetical protein
LPQSRGQPSRHYKEVHVPAETVPKALDPPSDKSDHPAQTYLEQRKAFDGEIRQNKELIDLWVYAAQNTAPAILGIVCLCYLVIGFIQLEHAALSSVVVSIEAHPIITTIYAVPATIFVLAHIAMGVISLHKH